MVFPPRKAFEAVAAKDDNEFLIRRFFRKMNKGMNGITGPGEMEFNIGNFKLVIIINGCPHHIIPVEFMQQSFARFQRVLRRDDKPDFVEISCLYHDIGNNHVPRMDGVKGAKEETNFLIQLKSFSIDVLM